jgi:hypothetical protein
MPYNPNATWTASTAELAKHAVYIVRFDGLASVQFSSGPVKSPSRTTKQYISGGITGLSQSVDPVSGRYTVGPISFVLTDKNSEITDLIATEQTSPDLPTLINRKVTILSGYVQDAESTYATIYVGFINDVVLARDGAAWTFELGDPKRATLEDIFTNADATATEVNTTMQAVSAGSITLQLTTTANISPNDKLVLRQASAPFNEEIVTVSKVTGSSGVVLTTAIVNTYGASSTVRWATTKLAGQPHNIFYSLLTGTFCKAADTVSTTLDGSAAAAQKVIPLTATTGIAVDGEYLIRKADGSYQEVVKVASISAGVSVTAHNNLARAYASSDLFLNTPFPLTDYRGLPTGLGMAPADIDEAGIQAERDDLASLLTMSFEVSRRERAKTWFERELFRFLGYPVVTPDGKLSFKCYGPRRPNVTILDVDEDDIISWSFRRRFDIAYNKLRIKYGYQVEADRFISEWIVEDTTDQATVGVRELVMESRGFNQSTVIDAYLDTFGRRFIRRFSKGVPEIGLRVHLTKRGWAIGEACDLAHSKIPNVRTGARGMAAPVTTTPAPGWEAVKIDHHLGPEEGYLDVVLQDNAYTRPFWIAPAAQPDYGSASAAQKRYAYISPAAGANFSDGTEPYKVI